MKRSEFLKKCVVLTAGSLIAGQSMARQITGPAVPGAVEPVAAGKLDGLSGLSGQADAATAAETVTILYTNDTHARLDPFPDNAVEYAGLGGISRRATLVKKIRRGSPHTLLLDAGDVFQGTPWFNVFGGEKDLKLMSQMGYDAICLGNHEFDNGLDGFADVAPAADFPILCANYRVDGTPMAPFVEPFIVREVAGLRFGIFGLGIRLDGVVRPELYGDVEYLDPVRWARGMAESLRGYHRCDYIICLSHLGYHYDDERIDDRKLASQTNGIDLVIGGHTHTFMDQPEAIRTPDGNSTLVTQAGHSGINLGRVDLQFDEFGRISQTLAHQYTIGARDHVAG